MIKLNLTKNKLITVINGINMMSESITKTKKDLKDWPLVHANAHLFVLADLSRRMRSKLIMLEPKQGSYSFKFSINEIQGLVFIINKGNFNSDPYTMSVIEEISNTIFLKLLS